MLSRIKSGSLRLLYGAVPLTILITVFSSVTASAAVSGTAQASTQVTCVSSVTIINGNHRTVKQTSGCHGCLTALNAKRYGRGGKQRLCPVLHTQQRLTSEQLAALERVQRELEALQYSHLSTDQIQSQVAELAN